MKKIALLIGDISSEFQSVLISSIYSRCKEYGYLIHAFVVYGLFGYNAYHTMAEISSFQIPTLDTYDAVLIVPDSFENGVVYESYREKTLKNLKCPIISIRTYDSDFYSVVFDDFTSMHQMVTHFIEHHHMTNICYVSGPKDRVDSTERLRGYREAMNEHRLPVNDSMIYYGNFWKDKGPNIVDYFIQDPKQLPEAIICANDYMAESVVTELQARGYIIPDDICVSGFDDLDEVMLLSPPLTSVHVDTESFGINAVEMLHALFENHPVEKIVKIPSLPVFRGSCGCPYRQGNLYVRNLFNRITKIQLTIGNITNQMIDFSTVNSYSELYHAAIPYVSNCDLQKIYVCLCDEAEKNMAEAELYSRFTEKMRLACILDRDEYETTNITFSRSSILPDEYLNTIKFPIITSMYNMDRYLGYLVADCGDVTHIANMQYMFRCWIQDFSTTINRIQLYEENKILSRIWEYNNRDELTGLLNRRGFEVFIQDIIKNSPKEKCRFYIISTDMDGLKYINDNFGHQEGDKAIIAFTKIISDTCNGMGAVARVGGDEFLIGLNTPDEAAVQSYILSVKAQMEEYNFSRQNSYELGGSFGYDFYVPERGLAEVLRVADTNMYAEKITHKHNRK